MGGTLRLGEAEPRGSIRRAQRQGGRSLSQAQLVRPWRAEHTALRSQGQPLTFRTAVSGVRGRRITFVCPDEVQAGPLRKRALPKSLPEPRPRTGPIRERERAGSASRPPCNHHIRYRTLETAMYCFFSSPLCPFQALSSISPGAVCAKDRFDVRRSSEIGRGSAQGALHNSLPCAAPAHAFAFISGQTSSGLLDYLLDAPWPAHLHPFRGVYAARQCPLVG